MNKTMKIYDKDNQSVKLWQILEQIYVGQTFEIDNYYFDKTDTYKMPIDSKQSDELIEEIGKKYSLNWDLAGIEVIDNHLVIHVEDEWQ